MKERLNNIDVIRAICAIGIICFHFACHTNNDYKFMLSYANGQWGTTLVIVFFLISGGMLYYNNPKLDTIRLFYYKRIRSIFPSFYIAYMVFFFENVIKTKTFFYNTAANPFSIILSVMGLDGYFLYAIPDYYILGEWFLGAIILLYVLYPFLLYCFRKSPWLGLGGCTGLFLAVAFYNVFQINQIRNLLTCIFVFYVGMILIKYRRIICNKIVFLIALIIDLVLYFVPVTCGAGIVFEMLFGIAFFVVLYNVGNIIIKGKALNNFFRFIGSISYQIFLLQHVIILKVFNIYNPSNNRDYWLVLGFTIMLTIGCSFVLQKLTSFVMRSSVVKDFESNVLKIGR